MLAHGIKHWRQDACLATCGLIPLPQGGMSTCQQDIHWYSSMINSALIVTQRGQFSSPHSGQVSQWSALLVIEGFFGFSRHTGLTTTPQGCSGPYWGLQLQKHKNLINGRTNCSRVFICTKTFWVGYSQGFNFSKVYQSILYRRKKNAYNTFPSYEKSLI